MPKICNFENCRKYANYGEYYSKPLRCKEHKENYKLVSKICQEYSCKIRSSFNFEGEKQSKFCSTHKENGMVDINSKTCQYLGCAIRSSFNFEGKKQSKFCSKHKENGMINVEVFNKTCQYTGCKTISNFNFEGEKFGKFCSIHKENGMVDIKHKTCQKNNCKIQPVFNFKGETQPQFCSKHKENGMINILIKTCEHPECEVSAVFNFLGEKYYKFCSKHKENGMIDIKSKPCQHPGCNIRPIFNFEDEKFGKFCSNHKLDGMIDIKNKHCKAYDPIKNEYYCKTQSNIKYKGYCSHCYQFLFPNDPLSFQIRSKTKEIATRNYINYNFEGFIHDKPLYTGNCNCTHRRRIDHRVLIGNTLLCVETDEGQHKDYNKKDEEIRYDDLFMIHSGKFVFIRFNPDKYINKNNKSVNPMLYTRLPILKEEIEKQLDRIKNEENTELLEIIKLYYDGYN